MLAKKKKIFILTGMIALLVLTGVLNIVLNLTADSGPADDVNAGSTYTDFFTAYKTDRTASREQTMLYYDEIIASAESSAESKAEAEAAKLDLAEAWRPSWYSKG